MSLVLLGAASLGAFYLVGNNVDKNNAALAAKQPDTGASQGVVRRELYTGRYGDFKDIALAPFDETLIRSITIDRDLSGVPYRWIEMGNGAVYRTYDMEFPQKK